MLTVYNERNECIAFVAILNDELLVIPQAVRPGSFLEHCFEAGPLRFSPDSFSETAEIEIFIRHLNDMNAGLLSIGDLIIATTMMDYHATC